MDLSLKSFCQPGVVSGVPGLAAFFYRSKILSQIVYSRTSLDCDLSELTSVLLSQWRPSDYNPLKSRKITQLVRRGSKVQEDSIQSSENSKVYFQWGKKYDIAIVFDRDSLQDQGTVHVAFDRLEAWINQHFSRLFSAFPLIS